MVELYAINITCCQLIQSYNILGIMVLYFKQVFDLSVSCIGNLDTHLNIPVYNHEPVKAPEAVTARMDLNAEAKRRMLRLFFSFSDVRKSFVPVFWWQRYVGMY